jgi:hypothetical protein
LNWRELNRTLSTLSELQVLELLETEQVEQKRIAILERLHQRYNSMRVARERIEILRKAR